MFGLVRNCKMVSPRFCQASLYFWQEGKSCADGFIEVCHSATLGLSMTPCWRCGPFSSPAGSSLLSEVPVFQADIFLPLVFY